MACFRSVRTAPVKPLDPDAGLFDFLVLSHARLSYGDRQFLVYVVVDPAAMEAHV